MNQLHVIAAFLITSVVIVATIRSCTGTRQPHTASTPRSQSPDSPTVESIVATSEASVALVKGHFGSGTGFLVKPSILVTNRHVIAIEFVDTVSIYFPSADSRSRGPFAVTLLYEEDEADLAVLAVQTTQRPLPLSNAYQFRRGQEVIVIGSPGLTNNLVLQNAISKGLMSTEIYLDRRPYYQLSISVNPGNSGGPVLDGRGEVIGVVTSRASTQEGVGFCIPIDQLRATVAKAEARSPREIMVAQSTHRARAAYAFLGVMGISCGAIMECYVEAMREAIGRGQTIDAAVEATMLEVQTEILRMDKIVASIDVEREVARIASDRTIPEAVRTDFARLWANYLEIVSYVKRPRGSYNTYSAKANELFDNHERLSQSLRLLLGIGTDQE